MPKSPPVTRTVYSLTLATHLIILNFSRLLLKFHECLNFNTEQIKCPRYREVVASILQKAEFSCSILRSVAVTLITTPPPWQGRSTFWQKSCPDCSNPGLSMLCPPQHSRTRAQMRCNPPAVRCSG